MPFILLCDGVVSENIDLSPTCSDSWTVTEYVTVQPFDLSQLDPAILTAAFSAGWGLVAFYYVSTVGLVHILKLIQR